MLEVPALEGAGLWKLLNVLALEARRKLIVAQWPDLAGDNFWYPSMRSPPNPAAVQRTPKPYPSVPAAQATRKAPPSQTSNATQPKQIFI